MRLPKMARARVSLLTALAAAGVFLAGCAHDATAPKASPAASQLSKSPFVPTAAEKSLVGVTDGTYSITIDPTQDQTLRLGPNRLDLPANSVCDLEESDYGPEHWNEACKPQQQPVTLTVVVKNANSPSPSIDFYPAMRFNPRNSVNLYLYVPTDLHGFAKRWTVEYCDTPSHCYDESLADSDLKTSVDADDDMVFRRIKHFSGYVVAERLLYSRW